MDALKLLLIVCASFVIGFGLPVIIYLAVRGGSGLKELQVLGRAVASTSRGWKSQDRDLEELSRRVAELNESEPEDTERGEG